MSQVKGNAKKFVFFQRFKNTIATKLTIWFLLLSLAPLFILFVFVWNNVDQQFIEMTTQNMYEQTKLLGTEISLLDNTDSIKTLFIQNHSKKFESFVVGTNETNVVYFGERGKFDEIYNKISTEIIRQISIKSDGVFVDADKKWAAAFYKVPGKEFIVISFVDISDALLPVTQIENTGLSQIGAALFVAAVVSGLFIFLTLKPIQELVKSTEKVRAGNLDIRIDPSRFEGEMETLAIGFEQMIKDLKIYQNQIKKHGEELEQKVTKRTKELDTKINELTATKTAVLNMMEDTDETNKKLVETQEELKNSLEELKSLDVKKDEFISIAAHELKTPLTSIHGFSQLLQNRDVAKNPEKREKYLKIMDSETKRLAKLVTDILDLSRIDLGTLKLNFEEVEISRLMEDVRREMNVQMKKRGLKSEYDLEKGLPDIVTDKERLTEILLNLINNAIKYTPKGKITVKVSRENDFVHFTVKDTGIGIEKEYYDKLFQRFYQIDSSYTRKAGGTGLGLALCREFVTLLGGKIWFESEEGKGSEFHFILPLKGVKKEVMSEEERKAREALNKSERVSKKLEKPGLGLSFFFKVFPDSFIFG
jgi:signal transduction histidine kinase